MYSSSLRTASWAFASLAAIAKKDCWQEGEEPMGQWYELGRGHRDKTNDGCEDSGRSGWSKQGHTGAVPTPSTRQVTRDSTPRERVASDLGHHLRQGLLRTAEFSSFYPPPLHGLLLQLHT